MQELRPLATYCTTSIRHSGLPIFFFSLGGLAVSFHAESPIFIRVIPRMQHRPGGRMEGKYRGNGADKCPHSECTSYSP